MPKRILLSPQTIQSTPTVPVNYNFINPENTLAHKETRTYSYSVNTDRLYVYLDSLPFSGNTHVEKNPANSDMYVHPATTDTVLQVNLYTKSEVYWTLVNESDYYLVFAIHWPGDSVQNEILPPHGTYSTLRKINGYHTLYLSYILKQGGTRKRFVPQIPAYPLAFQSFNESIQSYVYRRDTTHQLKHPSISVGLFASSSGTKTCIIEIDKVGVPTYSGRGVTGPDTVFLELDTLDKWHKIPIVCSTTGWYVEHIKWVNKTDYYLCVYVEEEEGTFNIIPPKDNVTQNFVTPTSDFTTRIYYILNGGGAYKLRTSHLGGF